MLSAAKNLSSGECGFFAALSMTAHLRAGCYCSSRQRFHLSPCAILRMYLWHSLRSLESEEAEMTHIVSQTRKVAACSEEEKETFYRLLCHEFMGVSWHDFM